MSSFGEDRYTGYRITYGAEAYEKIRNSKVQSWELEALVVRF